MDALADAHATGHSNPFAHDSAHGHADLDAGPERGSKTHGYPTRANCDRKPGPRGIADDSAVTGRDRSFDPITLAVSGTDWLTFTNACALDCAVGDARFTRTLSGHGQASSDADCGERGSRAVYFGPAPADPHACIAPTGPDVCQGRQDGLDPGVDGHRARDGGRRHRSDLVRRPCRLRGDGNGIAETLGRADRQSFNLVRYRREDF
jgi:hypothetical protein